MTQVEEGDLLQELECPICFDYLKPPIRMCTSGHSICDLCRRKCNNCPFCDSKFSMGRNVTLENVAHKIKYPCEYTRHGCTKKFTCGEKIEHEKNCSYKGLKCPKEGCTFLGLLQDQTNHCRSSHDYMDITSMLPDVNFNFAFVIIYNKSNGLIKINENYFWLRGKVDDDNVYFCVQMVANKIESSNYRYKIVISNEDRNILFQDSCKSFDVEDEDLFSNTNSFSLSLKSCTFYTTNSWKQTINIEKIEKHNNSLKFSWYQAFVLLVFVLLALVYVCQYLYKIDYSVILFPSFTQVKKEKNIKHKYKNKYAFHHKIGYEFNLNIWTVFETLVVPIIIFFIVFKVSRRYLLIFGL